MSSFSTQQHGNHVFTLLTRALADADVLLPHCSANNFALKAKRKTLGAVDVFSALEDMEFETFIPELKECLEGMSLGLGGLFSWISVDSHQNLLYPLITHYSN